MNPYRELPPRLDGTPGVPVGDDVPGPLPGRPAGVSGYTPSGEILMIGALADGYVRRDGRRRRVRRAVILGLAVWPVLGAAAYAFLGLRHLVG